MEGWDSVGVNLPAGELLSRMFKYFCTPLQIQGTLRMEAKYSYNQLLS